MGRTPSDLEERSWLLSYSFAIESYSDLLVLSPSQTVFERNCRSEDCAADLQLQGHLLLSSIDEKTPYLALGAVKNISLNISISNLGDDAYDANVSFNVSRELFFINMWQKVRRDPSKKSLGSIWCIC